MKMLAAATACLAIAPAFAAVTPLPAPFAQKDDPARWYIRSRRRVRASEPLIRLDRLLGRASRPTASQHVVRNLGLHANHDSDIAVGLLAGLDLD